MFIPIALLISSTYYWMLLMLTSLIVAIVGVVLFVLRSKQASRLITALESADSELANLKPASMEHLGSVDTAIDKIKVDSLSAEFDRLTTVSKEQYQEEYFVDPRSLIATLKQSPDYTRLQSSSSQIVALIGLVLTVLLIAFQNFFTGSNALMLSSSAFPFLLGLLLTYLILSSTRADQLNIDYQADRLYARIKMALPIYDPEAASRLLVERFVSYNDTLSQSAKDLVATEVIAGVSANLDLLLQKDLVPSLQQSSERLSQLAERLEEKQDQGMHALASTFSQALTEKLEAQFKPMADQIHSYAGLMADSHKRTEESIGLFNQHRESLTHAATAIEGSLLQLQEERQAWRVEQQQLNQNIHELSEASTALNQLQMSSLASFSERFEQVAEQLDRFTSLNQENQDKLLTLTNGFDALVRENMHENHNLLQDYRLLSAEIKSSTKQMEQSNLELASHLNRLSESLDASVSRFTTQIEQQVDGTLSDFDKGLAEMSLRLAHSATEMRDTAHLLNRQTADLKGRLSRKSDYPAEAVHARESAQAIDKTE